ncbi:bacteriohemerythrin [Candidatus Ferrigenium straubiae]|jgi:hemerythrin|uniref:bacteriohemerythrin n=1 Tax=Candidatus Ferrigenium straubiae TaxID=2919506 RepID=UPI003F4ACA62
MEKIIWWKSRRPAGFAWSKQLSIGNAILDSEHRNLISKINNILRMIEAGNAAELPGAFELLETWLVTHFENERIFALSIGLDFGRHDLAHRRLLDELQYLRDELAANNWTMPGNKIRTLYQFLRDWLVGHITEDDMQMKPAFGNCQYEYIPSYKNSLAMGN